MSFGIPNEGGGGDFLPLLSYNAKSGRFSFIERVETAAGWQRQEVELEPAQCVFLMDFATAVKGWLLFRKGAAPIKVTVEMEHPVSEFPPCPHGDFGFNSDGKPVRPQAGFVMHIVDMKKTVREFASNARACVDGVGALYGKVKAAPEWFDGMVPLCKLTRTTKVGKHGIYQPEFEVVKWAPRPGDLIPAKGEGGPAVTWQGATPRQAPAMGIPSAPVAHRAPPPATPPIDDEIPF